MEACSDGDASSSSILSQSRHGKVGVFFVALVRTMASDEKPRASGISFSSTANSTSCSVAVMGAAAGSWGGAASSIELVPVAGVDVSVRDVVVVVCDFVVLVIAVPVGGEDVVLVAVDDEVRGVVHDTAAASTLSSVVAFMKAATARHSSRSEDNRDVSSAGETSSVMGAVRGCIALPSSQPSSRNGAMPLPAYITEA